MSTTKKSSTVDCSWHTIKTNLGDVLAFLYQMAINFQLTFVQVVKTMTMNVRDKYVCMHVM